MGIHFLPVATVTCGEYSVVVYTWLSVGLCKISTVSGQISHSIDCIGAVFCRLIVGVRIINTSNSFTYSIRVDLFLIRYAKSIQN